MGTIFENTRIEYFEHNLQRPSGELVGSYTLECKCGCVEGAFHIDSRETHIPRADRGEGYAFPVQKFTPEHINSSVYEETPISGSDKGQG
jgi:hypothetical protein